MFDAGTRLFFFACLNDAAGAALINVAPAPTNKKIGSGSGVALKVAAPGGSGSATLGPKMFYNRIFLYRGQKPPSGQF